MGPKDDGKTKLPILAASEGLKSILSVYVAAAFREYTSAGVYVFRREYNPAGSSSRNAYTSPCRRGRGAPPMSLPMERPPRPPQMGSRLQPQKGRSRCRGARPERQRQCKSRRRGRLATRFRSTRSLKLHRQMQRPRQPTQRRRLQRTRPRRRSIQHQGRVPGSMLVRGRHTLSRRRRELRVTSHKSRVMSVHE